MDTKNTTRANVARKPLPAPAWRGGFYLDNGMYCVYGYNTDGLCVDVYLTRRMERLVAMRHGFDGSAGGELNVERLKALMNSMRPQFEAAARGGA